MSTPPRIPGTSAYDLSSLSSRSPASSARPQVNPLGVPTPPPPNPYGADIGELTPSERNEAAILVGQLMRKYSDKEMTEARITQFENESRARFAEELGLVVSFDYDNAVADADPNSDKVWFCPSIVIEARVEEKSIDFDRISHEVRSGEADGTPGVIRDGKFYDDPKKKNIS